jgi:hypothetical protein
MILAIRFSLVVVLGYLIPERAQESGELEWKAARFSLKQNLEGPQKYCLRA